MLRALVVALVAVAAALPLNAPAVTAAKTVSYETSYRQTMPVLESARFTGYLTLTFGEDGIISGRYRDEYDPTPHPVVGGYRDNQLWFSIGIRGHNQFTGTLAADGSIRGTLSGWHRAVAGEFTAHPSTRAPGARS